MGEKGMSLKIGLRDSQDKPEWAVSEGEPKAELK